MVNIGLEGVRAWDKRLKKGVWDSGTRDFSNIIAFSEAIASVFLGHLCFGGDTKKPPPHWKA